MFKKPFSKVDGSLSLVFNTSFESRRNGQLDKAQKVVDSECLRLSQPYIPFDKGISSKLMIASTVIGSGQLKTGAPYDAKNYYNPQFNFQGAPMRGAYWFERMKQSHVDQIKKKAGGEFT